MKFTDGYWQLRPGVSVLRPGGVDSVEPDERGFTVFAPTGQITGRGDTLNMPDRHRGALLAAPTASSACRSATTPVACPSSPGSRLPRATTTR